MSTGSHIASVSINVPPPTGISVVIKQNGTTVATSTAATPAQNHIELLATLAINAGDVISFVISSSTVADSLPNVFKAILRLNRGSLN